MSNIQSDANEFYCWASGLLQLSSTVRDQSVVSHANSIFNYSIFFLFSTKFCLTLTSNNDFTVQSDGN